MSFTSNDDYEDEFSDMDSEPSTVHQTGISTVTTNLDVGGVRKEMDVSDVSSYLKRNGIPDQYCQVFSGQKYLP